MKSILRRIQVAGLLAGLVFGSSLAVAQDTKRRQSPADQEASWRKHLAALESRSGRTAGDYSPEKLPDGTAQEVSAPLELGTDAYEHGYFSQCLTLWPRAWEAGKDSPDENVRAWADRAFAESMKMLSRLGRVTELRAGLESVEGRVFRGSTAEMVQVARDALWVMENKPEVSFRCGPAALQRILMHTGAADMWPVEIVNSQSPQEGIALTEVAALSAKIGMNYQMAKRVAAAAEIPAPAVVHWKLDHYGAVVKKENGRWLLDDPTFGNGLMWIGEDALRSGSSGYFLLPPGPLPAGWVRVDEKEGARVFGRGYPNSDQPGANGPGNPKPRPNPPNPPPGDPDDDDFGKGGGNEDNRTPNDGMAGWDVALMMASLEVSDVPVGYRPPVGPAIYFQVQYNQRETNQPAVLDYANFGKLWNCDWIGSLTFDSATAYYNRGQGGIETFTGFDAATQSYAPGYLLANRLVKISATSYELRRPDGGKLVFSLPNNPVTPTRIFMTQVVDAQGNAAVLTYDASFRLTGVKDAIGQTSTLTYGTGAESLLVKTITDPFGRSATFDYDASGRLFKITDVIGMTSEFTYATGDVLQTLKTAYGTTSFSIGSVTGNRFVEVTHPGGDRERFEQRNGGTPGVLFSEPAASVPKGFTYFNAYLDGRNTFHWDRKAMKEAPGDYSRARLYHFLHQDINTRSPIMESYKLPGEQRVWFSYQGQNNGGFFNQGAMGHMPSRVARVLDDGMTQATETDYNAAGLAVRVTDAMGRTDSFTYAPNGLDVMEIRRKTGPTESVRMAAFTWDAKRRPLTATDTAGQTTAFTWSERGQMETETNALGETTRYNYDARGYLSSIDLPLPGTTDVVRYTYDALGRTKTIAGVDGYTVEFAWDALNRPVRLTYPDGTFRQIVWERLDPVQMIDRRGRTTVHTYDSMGQLTSTRDPLGRTTRYEWCRCGDLASATDPLNRTTRWQYDFAGRMVAAEYADGSRETYAYDTAGRLLSHTDPGGQLRRYSYNTAGQLTLIQYENAAVPTPSVAYAYDPWFGRPTSRTDGTGVTRFTYHPVGSPPAPGAAALATTDGPLPDDTITFGYDPLGRKVSRSIGAAAESVQYDALGRVSGESNALGAFVFAYVGATARLSSATFPNGQSTEYEFFPASADEQLKTIRHRRPGGGILSAFGYIYDVAGHLTEWSQQQDAGAPRVWQFGYDAADQLESVAASSPASASSWSYDLAGNRRTATVNGATTSGAYNVLNLPVTFDPPALIDRSFEWDAEDRLTAIVYAGTSRRSEFSYDGLGRRVRIVEKDGGSVTADRRFVWCGSSLCEERDAQGHTVKRFFPQGFEATGGAGAGKFYYSTDHLGSIREILDETGQLRGRFEYDAWGRTSRVAGDVEADERFTGHFHHAASGLHMAILRCYDPSLGRWLSRDPAGADELSHLYRYAANNPVNFFDPDGADWADDADTWLGEHPLINKALQEGLKQGFDKLADKLDPTGWGKKAGEITTTLFPPNIHIPRSRPKPKTPTTDPPYPRFIPPPPVKDGGPKPLYKDKGKPTKPSTTGHPGRPAPAPGRPLATPHGPISPEPWTVDVWKGSHLEKVTFP